jgi:hypothetical protein
MDHIHDDSKSYKITLWLLLLSISAFAALLIDYFLESLPIFSLSMLMILMILVLIAWFYNL